MSRRRGCCARCCRSERAPCCACSRRGFCGQFRPMTDSALPLTARAPRTPLALYLELIRFNRPAGWLVLLWPTLVALWVAAGGFPGWHLLAVFVAGTILTRSAGCVINDIADREFDRHVQRTRHRPLTTGELPVAEAGMVGV